MKVWPRVLALLRLALGLKLDDGGARISKRKMDVSTHPGVPRSAQDQEAASRLITSDWS